MSFDEMRAHPEPAKAGLRENWDEAERSYAAAALVFPQEIVPANKRQRETVYVFESEPAVPELSKEKIFEQKEGKPKNFVESNGVGDQHKIGSPAMQPKSEFEEPMPTTQSTT